MADLITCPTCGTPDQEVGKYCEHCGSKIEPGGARVDNPVDVAATPQVDDPAIATSNNGSAPSPVPMTPSGNGSAPAVPDAAAMADTVDTAPPAAPSDTDTLRFIRTDNGVMVHDQAFDVPVGSRLLVGRADPGNGVFPEVDVTNWSKRVPTPEGSLYTVHRKQCYISRDDAGQVWIVDHTDYVGDTMVSFVGSGQFRPIPSLANERPTNAEGGVALDVGDRILMGQGEGMLIFQLMRV